MKRKSESNYERRDQKRSRQPEDNSLRILIPSKAARYIIGKGGNNITRLRKDFNAKIRVPDSSGPERVVSITAADKETNLKILEEVIYSMKEYFSSAKNGVDVRLLVHQSHAGCVIGKGGAKVKELRESTKGKIKIYRCCCPRSSDMVVSIIGSPEICMTAVREILKLLEDIPQKGYSEPYDANNFEEEFADDYGGWGCGRSGGVPIWEGRSSGRFLAPGPQSVPFWRGDVPEETRVTIPEDLAGAIIGKGGSRIRQVRMDSGADITIDDLLPGSYDRVITIKGYPDQIQLAQHLLQQAAKESLRS